jgi:ribosome maturation factor RimP
LLFEGPFPEPTAEEQTRRERAVDVTETVTDLLTPVLVSMGLDLVDVEYGGATLRVVVDEPGRVTTDRLAKANRAISVLLDEHDPIPGRYTLEVSSPGVERPLKRLEHFERAVGEDVVVKLVAGLTPRRIKGRLDAVQGDSLAIRVAEIDGTAVQGAELRQVLMADIDKARTVFEWGPSPKPGHGPKVKPTSREPKEEVE